MSFARSMSIGRCVNFELATSRCRAPSNSRTLERIFLCHKKGDFITQLNLVLASLVLQDGDPESLAPAGRFERSSPLSNREINLSCKLLISLGNLSDVSIIWLFTSSKELKCMKELFLRLNLARKKLNIIY